jgi:hypothetical protein
MAKLKLDNGKTVKLGFETNGDGSVDISGDGWFIFKLLPNGKFARYKSIGNYSGFKVNNDGRIKQDKTVDE